METQRLRTATEHEQEAERLLREAREATAWLPEVVAAAQVHATLAVAARLAGRA